MRCSSSRASWRSSRPFLPRSTSVSVPKITGSASAPARSVSRCFSAPGNRAHSCPASDIRRRTARNSIADVNALYRVQLEALWGSVEGSQKFLPATPGRHIQAETTAFVSLHPATYRPRQAVHLFLLNDALLVATKKRTGMGSTKVKLVAEKCFALSEIAVIDLKDGGGALTALFSNAEAEVLRRQT